jgi:hypothetical protein
LWSVHPWLRVSDARHVALLWLCSTTTLGRSEETGEKRARRWRRHEGKWGHEWGWVCACCGAMRVAI